MHHTLSVAALYLFVNTLCRRLGEREKPLIHFNSLMTEVMSIRYRNHSDSAVSFHSRANVKNGMRLKT